MPPLSALTPTVSPTADKLSGSVVVGTKAESVRIIPSSKMNGVTKTTPARCLMSLPLRKRAGGCGPAFHGRANAMLALKSCKDWRKGDVYVTQ